MDAGGILHCVDAKTGKPYWTHETLGGISSVLIFGKHIYACHNRVMSVFRLSGDPTIAMENGEPFRKSTMGSNIYGTPVLSNNVLYVPTMFDAQLFAITEGANEKKPGRHKAGKSPKTGN